jgi:hypothetical protein
MKCPECGTRLHENVKKCHFCGYVFPENEKDSEIKPTTELHDREDPSWRISSYQMASISMLAIIFSALAFALSSASALTDALFPRKSTQIGNITISYPPSITIGWLTFPSVTLTLAVSLVVVFVTYIVYFYYILSAEKSHFERKEK